MKYNISNLDEFIKTINSSGLNIKTMQNKFITQIIDDSIRNQTEVIDNAIRELIKPYIDTKFNNFNAYEIAEVYEKLEEKGYKLNYLENEYFKEYSIIDTKTYDKDYFLVKNKTDINLEDNKYTATNYISSIIREIKDR